MRDQLECVWPAALDAARQPFRSGTWVAALSVAAGRDGGDFARTRPALILAAAAGLAIWVIGENFGQILTGTATDPNTGPLLVMLSAAYWPAC